MQIEDPLPAKESWLDSIAAALSLVMAFVAVSLITGFAAYGAALHPESFGSPDEHIGGGDRRPDRRQ
jgi:hypothetical protein